MQLETIRYIDQEATTPQTGRTITAQQDADHIIVYQAYNKQIADYAVAHQQLGGPDFSYERMSWIKPGFLWMMYRCGWGSKEGQENVLALRIRKTDFEYLLSNTAYSTFKRKIYTDKAAWQKALEQKEGRLQWDPDHDPYGREIERRAIQVGLKGSLLQQFGKEMIHSIENISGFVQEQKQILDKEGLEHLYVPATTLFLPQQPELRQWLGIGRMDE